MKNFNEIFFGKLYNIYQIVFLFSISVLFTVSASAHSKRGIVNTTIHNKSIFADHTVNGMVSDDEGNPLAGVSVKVKGTDLGTATDAHGRFELLVPDNNAVLVFSHVEYITREIEIENKSTINVSLKSKTTGLGEVVVVGYGTQDKRALTSSVAVIPNADIKDIKATSFEQLLIGKAAGVTVLQSTGHPGAGLDIRVRGTGSISALNDPLYVVDGMPIESPGYDNRVDILSFLNPADIASITILKDAASTSIYGSRGSNGVVLITTKSAKSGKTSIDVSGFYGIQHIPQRGRFKMMNAEEFANFRIQAIQDADILSGTPFDESQVPVGYQNVKGSGTDWFKVVSRDYAPMQDYNITFRSGTAKARTLISTDYYSIDGNLKRTSYQRASVRANVDVDVSKHIHYGVRINPSYNFRDLGGAVEGFPTGALMGFALSASPISPVYLSDGSLNPVIAAAPENFVYPNPINRFNGITDLRNDFRLLASSYLNIDLWKGLTFKTNVGTDLNMSNSRYFYPSWVGASFAAFGGSINIPLGNAYGSASRDQFTHWMIENYLDYKTTVAQNHHLELMIGHSAEKQNYDDIGVTGSKYPNDNIPYVIAALPGDTRDGVDGSDNFRYGIESYFGRLNYNFKDKYFLMADIRRDGSSRFSPQARRGTFPAVSAGWMISNESFMKSLNFLNELKIRGSYGITGNDNVGSSFGYVPGLGVSNYVLGNNLAEGNYVNYADQGLKWESSKETDLGLDLAVLNNRLSFTADYYNRITYNLLLNRPIPTITGFSNAFTNIGKLQNKGFEFTVNSKNIQTKDIQWETSLNVSINRNKVLALNGSGNPIESGDQYQGSTITEVGKPIGLFKGYVIEGIYQTEEEADADHNHNPGAHAGTLIIKDVNNDGQITPADRTVIGNPWPKFTYGFSSHVNYRQFDFNVQITGSVGNHVILALYETLRNMDGPFNVLEAVKDRWRSPDNPGKGVYPTTNYPDQLQYIRLANNTWIKNATHATINNVTFGYTLSNQLFSKWNYIKSARIYLTIQNALQISKFPLNNPDASLQDGTLNMGWERDNYPLARQITFGANLSL